MKKPKIKELKEYFEKQPSVILAFLFGSHAKGFEMEESDVDIAVLFKPSLKNPEKERKKIWGEVTDIVEKEVDLIRLNEAPATLISDIFKTGLPLAIKNKKLYWELFLKKSKEGEDFLQFIQGFREIYKKARSLEPEKKALLEERIQFLKGELEEIDELKKLSFKEYEFNKLKRRNIERWTENILNATIDIAQIILASEKKRMPKSYKGALQNFCLFMGLNKKRAKEFSEFAELRNLLAHEYLEILYEKIQNFISKAPPFYRKIFDFLEEYLK